MDVVRYPIKESPVSEQKICVEFGFPTTMEKGKGKVKQDIRFILSHFEEPTFPRTIEA